MIISDSNNHDSSSNKYMISPKEKLKFKKLPSICFSHKVKLSLGEIGKIPIQFTFETLLRPVDLSCCRHKSKHPFTILLSLVTSSDSIFFHILKFLCVWFYVETLINHFKAIPFYASENINHFFCGALHGLY